MKDLALELLTMLGIEKQKDGYYHTAWGKKTEEGIRASISNVLKPFVEEYSISKDQLHRRNALIKKLREENSKLKERLASYYNQLKLDGEIK